MENLEVSPLIESSLISWANLFSWTPKVQSLYDLLNGQFFLALLAKTTNFRLLRELHLQPTQEPSLNQRLAIMKTLAESLLYYYQIELLRDVSQISFNYVELAQGSKPQMIKLILLVVGMLVQIDRINLQTERKPIFRVDLGEMKEEEREIFKTLIEYAVKLGCPQKKEEPSSDRKVIIGKLEELEERSEKMQQAHQKAQSKVDELQKREGVLLRRIKHLQQKEAKWSEKEYELGEQLESLQVQCSLLKCNNQGLEERNNVLKQKYQQKISELKCLLDSERAIVRKMEIKLTRQNELQQINQELKEKLRSVCQEQSRLRKDNDILQNKKTHLQQQLVTLTQHHQALLTKVELQQSKQEEPNFEDDIAISEGSDVDRFMEPQSLQGFNFDNSTVIKSIMKNNSAKKSSSAKRREMECSFGTEKMRSKIDLLENCKENIDSNEVHQEVSKGAKLFQHSHKFNNQLDQLILKAGNISLKKQEECLKAQNQLLLAQVLELWNECQHYRKEQTQKKRRMKLFEQKINSIFAAKNNP